MSEKKRTRTDKSRLEKQTHKSSTGRRKSANSSQIASVERQISGNGTPDKKRSAGKRRELVKTRRETLSRQKTAGRTRKTPKAGIVMRPDDHVYQFVAYQTSLPFEAFNVSYSRESHKATTRSKGQKDGDVSEMLLSELWVGYDEGSFAFVAKKKFRSYSRFLVSLITNEYMILGSLLVW